ncbi:MAG: MarR family transcriptional regulator [Chloroherpetonaceae bacterium]|nr:MarR family transcriptional regulator [Chthonomonadaceae bacterium]MDW8209012.1 MarR family transcriptional regulator [Chloroherpetonaceae bacterium]
MEQEVFLNLWRTFDRLKVLEEKLFSRYDLTAQQYNALRLLRAAHPESLQTLTLAARLISRAPDITRLLDRLEERGLIQRERPMEDRRMVQVRITPAGIALLQEMAGALQECHRQQLGHLSVEEQQLLIMLLRKARAPHEPPDSAWR